ncbi:MAG TPA: glycosyltransferase family 4 protein [Chthoniobacterales bacterium]|nr:glycosyltransferase family 4 protein [Chthoniobacterales bacterium]
MERLHDFISLENDKSKLESARKAVIEANLSIFNFYTDPFAQHLLNLRVHARKPWIFWGERPGFHVSPLLGKIVRRWSLRALHRSPAPIWGIGHWAVEQYKKEFGPHHRYADVPYFSDLRRFGDNRTTAATTTRFLFSGAITKRKGVDMLAKAFGQLAKAYPDVQLIVLGEGELLGEVKSTLVECADRVRFLGFKDWNELPSVYHCADFLCAPSRYDGWALVVPEALASGLPVIGTDRTGAAIEFIKTGTNGWLIPANDDSALLGAMRSAVNLTCEERQRYSANAKATVANHQLEDGVKRILAEINATLANWK